MTKEVGCARAAPAKTAMSRLEAFIFKFDSVMKVRRGVKIEVFICKICPGTLMLGASTLLLVAECTTISGRAIVI